MVSTHNESSLVFSSLLFLTPQNMFRALQLNPMQQQSGVTMFTKTKQQNKIKSKMPPSCSSYGIFSSPKMGKRPSHCSCCQLRHQHWRDSEWCFIVWWSLPLTNMACSSHHRRLQYNNTSFSASVNTCFILIMTWLCRHWNSSSRSSCNP